jgi:hypothetical protein
MRQSSDIPALRGRRHNAADASAAVNDPDFPALPDIPDAIRCHWSEDDQVKRHCQELEENARPPAALPSRSRSWPRR